MRRAGVALVAIVFVLFGLAGLEHALALVLGREPMIHALVGALSSRDFIHQPGGLFDATRQLYLAHLPRISFHIVCAALALTLGVFQFMPTLRREHPRWHRRSGWVMMVCSFATAAGAVAFLVAITPHESATGPAFYLGTWGLSLMLLFLLAQALLAVLSRDFRGHMVWVAAAYACLAAAPLLRVFWLGWAPLQAPSLAAINLAGGSCTLLIAQLMMSAWLAWIGDRDLPAARLAPVRSTWPRPVLLLLVGASVLVVLVVALQAVGGPDALAGWRSAAPGLAARLSALVWASGSLLLLLRFPTHWIDLLAGRRLDTRGLAGALTMSFGALLIGLTQPHSSPATWALATFWSYSGGLTLMLVAMTQIARNDSSGRNSWGVFLLFVALLPAAVAGLLPFGELLDMSLEEAMVAALFLGLGVLGTCGMATGRGARARYWIRREDQLPPELRNSGLRRAA